MDANLEKFFDLSIDLLVIGTTKGGFVKMSPSWTRVLGWTEEELRSQPTYVLIHPDDLQRTADIVLKAIEGEAIFQFENRYQHKQGHWVWLLSTGVYSAEDDLIYAIARDMTDYKKIENRLMESESRLNRAQHIANIGSWDLDLTDQNDVNANPLHWSDQVFRIFGYEPGEIAVSNENFFKAVHPDDHQKIQEAVAHALASKTDYDIEHRIILPNGEERIVREISKLKCDTETGQPTAMVGTVQDITEQKKLMHQLVASQKMESIGRLTGGIAHDFNNLLASMYGNLELMSLDIKPGHPSYRYMKTIESTAKRAADLTKHLLAFSRQQVMSLTLENLNDLILEAHKILARLLGSDIEILLDLHPDLGLIEADSSQMIQIVLNLTLNSRDAMPQGGKIKISTFQKDVKQIDPLKPDMKIGPYVVLQVADNGHGMDEVTLEKMFEPFFTTKPLGKGTGLGLSTVYGIVKQSGGFIYADSTPHIGTTFEIYLPMARKTQNKLTTQSKNRTAESGQGNLVLLIEDEKDLCSSIKEVLERSHYTVLTAEDGKTGLQMIHQNAAHLKLLISDVILPGIKGLDLIQRARELRPDLPVICLSGYPAQDINSSLPHQQITYLQKPFSFAVLLEKIQILTQENAPLK